MGRLAWALIALGASMMTTRTINIRRLTLLPVVMIIYSFTSALLSFGMKALVFACMVGRRCGGRVARQGLHAAGSGQVSGQRRFVEFEVSGSMIPMLLMLSIFCLKYAVAVLNVLEPMLIADPMIAASLCAILGMKSGAFLARPAIAIRAEKSQPALAQCHQPPRDEIAELHSLLPCTTIRFQGGGQQ